MRDVTKDLRIAYISRLRDNVLIEGDVIPVYGKVVPPDVESSYIYVNQQSSLNNSSKGCWGTDHTIVIECVTHSFDGGRSWVVDDIADQVMELITSHNPSEWPAIDPAFWLTDVQFESSTELNDWQNNTWVFRKLLTFNNLITEEEV